MLIVKAQMTVAPGDRAPFLEHVQELAQASRTEAGCLSAACYEDPTAPGTFIMLAEWEDQASLARHEETEHLAQFKAQVGAMIIAREATRVYTVSSVGGL